MHARLRERLILTRKTGEHGSPLQRIVILLKATVLATRHARPLVEHDLGYSKRSVRAVTKIKTYGVQLIRI